MRLASLVPVIGLLLNLCLAHSYRDLSGLFRRGITAPAPVVVTPSETWEGDDGFWSTFTFRIGNPAQNVRLLPSTASQQTLVVIPDGCPPGYLTDCASARGRLYNNSQSRTWEMKGFWNFSMERNLYDEVGSGQFGYDSIGVGAQGTNGPTLDHQLLGGIGGGPFFLGSFGLHHKAENYTDFNDPVPSYMTNLKNNGSIPSLSFGYTAGAIYQLKRVTGSLTLGGYDSSRFKSNNLTFTLASDTNRDLIVGLQSITSTEELEKKTNLLPSGILTYVDSTVPYIYLPVEACKKFEKTFGLTWDNTSELYLVNDTLHDDLKSRNPTFTFTLGNSQTGGQSVDIVLPYNSFDLQASAPLVRNSSRIFPLRRAAGESQYTLGRAFFQEAYLVVDWERHNFSISQCVFQDPNPQHIVAIPPVGATDSPTAPQRGGLSTGATVAIAVAVVFVTLALIAVALAILFVRRRRRRNSVAPPIPEKPEKPPPTPVPEPEEYRKPELDANNESVLNGVGEMKRPFHIDLGSGTTSEAMSMRGSISKIDLSTPASELPSPPIPMGSYFEMPAEEIPRPEFEDTSEGPRYETAKIRYKQRRAAGSYGSSNHENEGQNHMDTAAVSGGQKHEKPPMELHAEEISKDRAAQLSQNKDVASVPGDQQHDEHTLVNPVEETPKDGAKSDSHEATRPVAVSPEPQRSPRDPIEEAYEEGISPFANDDTGPFFSSQHAYEQPLLSPPLITPPLEKDRDVLAHIGSTMK
ncbi:hypothetical protein MMC16_007651 [Acarospora aff. strigata]|nr:hypothetical protein [Acarospora aff. strigata]